MSSATQPGLDAKVVEDVADIEIWDATGSKVRFGTLFEDQKTAVVFIRESPVSRHLSCLMPSDVSCP